MSEYLNNHYEVELFYPKRSNKIIANILFYYDCKKKFKITPINCYDFKYSVDLENLAKKKQLYPSEIIHFHKSKLYDVLSMGFLPGFMYLGFTNNQLHCERKETPSFKVNKGSIGIALNQTCIYPQDSPGGWHIIGVSPLNFFDLNLKNPCFAEPGDKIEFVEISIKEYLTMKKKKSIKPKYKIDD